MFSIKVEQHDLGASSTVSVTCRALLVCLGPEHGSEGFMTTEYCAASQLTFLLPSFVASCQSRLIIPTFSNFSIHHQPKIKRTYLKANKIITMNEWRFDFLLQDVDECYILCSAVHADPDLVSTTNEVNSRGRNSTILLIWICLSDFIRTAWLEWQIF